MIDKSRTYVCFSEVIAKATPEVVTATFNKMNPKPKENTVANVYLKLE
jgi:hypothetical protein